MTDGWEDIPDMLIPTIYLQWTMSTINELRDGKTYSDPAFEKIKDLLVSRFPLVCRHLSDDDVERIKALQRIPKFLGGLGE